MEVIIKNFFDLTNIELYELLSLRSEVFIVEQNCVYQDIDFKDKLALHVLLKKNKKLIGYSRLFKPGDYFKDSSIGRIVVIKEYREKGYGEELMKISIESINKYFKEKKIHISAQAYLKKFYKKFNFKVKGEEYLEDGIPHIKMVKN